MLSLVSIGGINVLLPEIRRQVVDVHGWMTDAAFAHTFAIASAAPGPNVIVVSLIGWQVAGWAGLLVATLAIMPSRLDTTPGVPWKRSPVMTAAFIVFGPGNNI